LRASSAGRAAQCAFAPLRTAQDGAGTKAAAAAVGADDRDVHIIFASNRHKGRRVVGASTIIISTISSSLARSRSDPKRLCHHQLTLRWSFWHAAYTQPHLHILLS
jgi:hypothetical protein